MPAFFKQFKRVPFVKIGGLFLVVICSGCSYNKVNPILYDQHFQHAFANKTIKVVAPGSGTDIKAIHALEALTYFNVNIPQNLVTQDIPLHANSDKQRFLFLKDAFLSPSKNTIIWSLRGGYGSARLINGLEKLKKPKTEKIFIGFSDITALHLFLSQKWQWKTIHGAGLVDILNPRKNPNNFRKIAEIVSGDASISRINNIMPLNDLAKKLKNVRGLLTGGNLSIVQSSIGTSWQIKAAGKILFLEDVNEPGYRIDKMLNHLKQAGVFKNVKGIIFGDFTDPEDKLIDMALERFALETKIPVFKTDQFGHGHTNYPLIYNSKSEIIFSHADNNYSLVMHF